MKDKYEPDYVSGEIVVVLQKEIGQNDGFIRGFAEVLGYSVIDDYEWGPFAYRIKTEPGREEEAIEEFKKEGRFIECAYLRDAEVERRVVVEREIMDSLEKILSDLGTADMPETEWNKVLEKAKVEIEKAKFK